MLSIGKTRLSGEGYYLAAVADGVDEYYRGVGEAPGRWTGDAALELGLEGEVGAEQLHAVWAGHHPGTGEALGRFPGREIAGYDLTFRAPKSVSLLALLGDPDTARTVTAAHEAAVDAAFSYIERNAARSRTGKNGVHQVEVEGLVAAAFRHRTSRAGDPHLHTHVLVANMAQGPDGVWRTLDGRWLYLHAKTAGYLYEAHLRDELTRRLGVEWGPVKNGIADVVGIDRSVIDHFSDRRRQIEEHLDEIGFRSARAAELAALETRQAKNTTLDVGSMRQVWEAKAAEIGFDPASLAELVDRVPRSFPVSVPISVPGLFPVSVPTPGQDRVAEQLLGPDGLTARASTFDRRDVLRGIAERMPAGATVAQIEAMADDFVTHPEVMRLLMPATGAGLLGSDVIRRADGTVVAVASPEARWSTLELIDLEQDLVDRATARAGDGSGIVPDQVLAQVLATRRTLVAEQASMVSRLTRSGNGIDVVSAAAGTGKTYTLDAARDAWQAAGYRVIGAAQAGIAAQELQSSAGIESSTLAMLQIDLDTGRTTLDARTVLVIDEAGMAGTRTLAPILAAADRAGAKVVLVGDPRQLPEIDAGGVLTGLSERLGPIELTHNRRQRQQWERDALAELRAGDIDVALTAYADNGRIVTGTNAHEVRRAIVADWWAYRLAGDTTTMTAFRRDDVDDLNGRARAYLTRAGQLHGPTLEINDRPYQAGDQIVCLRNNRRLGIHNGTRATITSIDPDHHAITIQTNRGRVRLPGEYVDAGHIAHGYATTIHKTQGATVDRGLLLGTDELFRERGYVGMSRGRLSNHLYLLGATPADDPTGHGPPAPTLEPADAVRQALHHQGEQRLAIDTGEPVAVWPLEKLVTERRRLAAVLAACPPDRDLDIVALTARRRDVTTELAPVVDRHAELASRTLRGRGTRTEMRDLQQRIEHLSGGADRLDAELEDARQGSDQRRRFLGDHAGDRRGLQDIDSQIDRYVETAVAQAAQSPSEYTLRVLGPVPRRSDHLERWVRGATILERYRIGLDSQDERGSTGLGGRDRAEMRARLEVIALPRPDQRLERTVELDNDLGLGL
jgi:conjugative relaxase-like TrwC/TraI family protein